MVTRYHLLLGALGHLRKVFGTYPTGVTGIAALSARAGDRFEGLTWRVTDGGAILLDGASAWLECSIDQAIRAGDHDIVVLRVHEFDADHDRRPLIFHASRFRWLNDD